MTDAGELSVEATLSASPETAARIPLDVVDYIRWRHALACMTRREGCTVRLRTACSRRRSTFRAPSTSACASSSFCLRCPRMRASPIISAKAFTSSGSARRSCRTTLRPGRAQHHRLLRVRLLRISELAIVRIRRRKPRPQRMRHRIFRTLQPEQCCSRPLRCRNRRLFSLSIAACKTPKALANFSPAVGARETTPGIAKLSGSKQ